MAEQSPMKSEKSETEQCELKSGWTKIAMGLKDVRLPRKCETCGSDMSIFGPVLLERVDEMRVEGSKVVRSGIRAKIWKFVCSRCGEVDQYADTEPTKFGVE